MYLAYTARGNAEYASIAERKGNGSAIQYTYLGKVLDRERGIYKNRERGIFTYDLLKNEYGPVPPDFEEQKGTDKRRKTPRVFDFGDVYLINEFLHRSGFWSVIDQIPWGNRDTLHAMVMFYITSQLPVWDADVWYETSFACKLFPEARLDRKSICDFLEQVGETESLLPYHEAYVRYVHEHYRKDRTVLVYSGGVPGKCDDFCTPANTLSAEGRIKVVAQRSTAIPLYFRLTKESTDDARTLRRLMEHCSAYGIGMDSCLLDSEYAEDSILDSFYDENLRCVFDYIARPEISASYVRQALPCILPALESKENLVNFEGSYYFIAEVDVKVGTGGDLPAFLYAGLELNGDSHALLTHADKDAPENQGVFTLLTGRKMRPEAVLPEYYAHLRIAHLNDVSAYNTKLLSSRRQNEKTYAGHVFLCMISTAIVRFIQIQMGDSETDFNSKLAALRGQKVIQYATGFVPDDPIKPARDMYKDMNVEIPAFLPITGGELSGHVRIRDNGDAETANG